MKKNTEANGTMDTKRLGRVLHGERLKQGYRTAEDFSEAIENTTGIAIPKDTIARIEAGRQEPKVSQYVGMALTLGKLYDTLLREALTDDLRRYRGAMYRAGGIVGKGITGDGREIVYKPDGSVEVDEAYPSFDSEIWAGPEYPHGL